MKNRNILTKLKEQERDTRKNLILDSAERLFATKPFDKVSMQEIADEAGLAKSSIYTYFPAQEDLFVEAALRDIHELLNNLEGMMAAKPNSDIGDIIDAFISYFVNHDSFFRMASLFMLHGTLSDESVDKLNMSGRKILDIFDMIFSKMNYKKDVRLLSHTVFSTLSGILISYRKYPGRNDDERIAHMKRIGSRVHDMIMSLIKMKK